jgi:hypothetical protein
MGFDLATGGKLQQVESDSQHASRCGKRETRRPITVANSIGRYASAQGCVYSAFCIVFSFSFGAVDLATGVPLPPHASDTITSRTAPASPLPSAAAKASSASPAVAAPTRAKAIASRSRMVPCHTALYACGEDRCAPVPGPVGRWGGGGQAGLGSIIQVWPGLGLGPRV